jgi:cyclopropane fatty-acyl-phospholipid synthase-like methyltransferase
MSAKRLLFDFLFLMFAQPRILRAWKHAYINRFNRQKINIKCPYCSYDKSEHVHRWTIDWTNEPVDYFGLFDNDQDRLNMIYGKNLTRILPAKALSRYLEKSLKLLNGRSYVDYRRCPECDLVFQNFPHTPASKEFYYREFYRLRYQKKHPETDVEVYGRSDQTWMYQQELIAKYFLQATQLPSSSRILDIGCAEGHVCKYLEHRQMIAFGIEPSVPMVNYAKHVLHLQNVIGGNYSADVYPTEFFDGIITHHVVEHIVEIRPFFAAMSKHLKQDGYLLLQTPCIDNLKSPTDYKRTLFGDHVYCYSEKFLRNALKQYGFEILECKNAPCDLSELDKADMTPYGTTAWADDPGGISILAKKT